MGMSPAIHTTGNCPIKACVSLLCAQNLTARMAYEKPADPLQFILDEIEKIRRGEKLEGLK